MDAVWERIRRARHTALLGTQPIEPPAEPRLCVLRVSCNRPPQPLGPVLEARHRVEMMLDASLPLIDMAADRVRSGLRRRLLGDAVEPERGAGLVEAVNRLVRQTDQPVVLIFDAIEAADEATLAFLRDVIVRPHWVQATLLLTSRELEPKGSAKALIELLEGTLGREAVLRVETETPATPETIPTTPLPAVPAKVLRVLRAGALIGPGFEAELVAALLDTSPDKVLERLQEALDAGVPVEDLGEGRFSLPGALADRLRESLLPSLSAAWHRRLAQLLSDEAEEETAPVEELEAPRTAPQTPPEAVRMSPVSDTPPTAPPLEPAEAAAPDLPLETSTPAAERTVDAPSAGPTAAPEASAAGELEQTPPPGAVTAPASEDEPPPLASTPWHDLYGEPRPGGWRAPLDADLEPPIPGDEDEAPEDRASVLNERAGALEDEDEAPNDRADAPNEPATRAEGGEAPADRDIDRADRRATPADQPEASWMPDWMSRATGAAPGAERADRLARSLEAILKAKRATRQGGDPPRSADMASMQGPGLEGARRQEPSRDQATRLRQGSPDRRPGGLTEPARAAGHFAAAGDSNAAAERYLAAASRAAQLGALPQAIQYAREAYSLLERLPLSPARRLLKARALLELGRLSWEAAGPSVEFTLNGALALLEQAGGLLEAGDPPALRAEVRTLIAAVCYDLGDKASLDRALEELTIASRTLQEAGDAVAAARLLNDQAAVWVRLGDPVRAVYLLTESRKVFERRAETDATASLELAETNHLLARLTLHVPPRPGREAEAIEVGLNHAREAAEAYRRLGAARELARVWETQGRLELKAGRREQAFRYLQRAVQAQQQLGDVIGLARTAAALSEMLCRGGRYEEALAMLGDSMSLNLEKGSPLGLAFNRQVLGNLTEKLTPQQRDALGPLLARVTERLATAESILGRVSLPGGLMG